MNSLALVTVVAVWASAHAGILAPSLYSAPLAAYHAPVLSAYSAPVVSAYSAPVVGGGVVAENSVVAGPSGTIVSGRTFGAPIVAGYGAPGVIAARTYVG